jgi:outer membrane immunogenic protein
MKRILLAGAFALAAATPSFAADLPQPMPPAPQAPAAYVPAPLPGYDWTGIYVGINGGYGFGSSNWTSGALSTGSFDTNGGLAGGTIGANFQTGQFVFGIEGDVDWAGISGTSALGVCGATTTCDTKSDWLGTVRGRVGYAFDRVMVYGTAGGAFGNIEAGPSSAGTLDSSIEFGWTAGAGVEVGITPYLTAKVEYLYVDLADGTCSAACAPTPPASVSFDTSLVRAGLNFKFNPF